MALVALLAGCGGTPASVAPATPSPAAHVITGKLGFLNGPHDVERSSTGCAGTGGYSDIKTGAQITVKDQTGTVIAVSSLMDDPATTALFDADQLKIACFYKFELPVPEATFYSIEIAGRDPVTKSAADLEAAKWDITLTLGT